MDKRNINEYADKTYDQVSSWINNCDSKASFILALIGVFLPITFTSDFFLTGIKEELKNIVGLISDRCSCRAWGSVLLILLLCVSILFFVRSLRFLFLVLLARLDDTRKEENPSVSFYKSIGAHSYEEYKQLVVDISDEDFTDDKLRQVHICSNICTQKFLNYNKGINAIKVALIFFGIFMALFFIFNNL